MKQLQIFFIFSIILFFSACADKVETDDLSLTDLEVVQRESLSCLNGCILPIVPEGQNFSSGVDIDVWTENGCYFWKVEPSGRLDRCGKISVKIFGGNCEELDSFQVSAGSSFLINYNDYPSTYCGAIVVYMQNSCGYTINCLYNDCVPMFPKSKTCFLC